VKTSPLYVILISILFCFGAAAAHAEQYEVLPQRSNMRGHLWVSEGPGLVTAENVSAANRFRLGIELQFGEDYRFDLGWTLLDNISSGETSAVVGNVSRSASDLNVGYYLVPDRLWLMYSLHFESVHGDNIGGYVSGYGHQLALGYQLYANRNMNIGVELAYLYMSPVTTKTFDYTTNLPGSATYPTAQIWSLNFKMGVDFGG
jgi:hypothetical protein